MRIALTNNFFLPRPSGSVHLTDGIAKRFAERGHEVMLITAQYAGAPVEEERAGYRIVRVPSWSLPKTRLSMNYDIPFTVRPGAYRRISKILDGFAPEVIHQHGQFWDLTWLSSLWARRHDVPTVVTVHTALTHTDPLLRAVLRTADLGVVRPIIAAARSRLVTIDWFIDDYVRRTYRNADRLAYFVPIGVEPDVFVNGDGTALRQQLDLGDRPVVLSIGHVIPLRNRLALVRAMPYLLEAKPDLAVIVVGKVYDDSFQVLARDLEVDGNLIVVGGVPHDDIPKYLDLADVEGHDFQNYGLGTASLEVMASGVPVVSVVRHDNFPGIELRSWENLVIVPPDDPRALAEAILRLIDEPEVAARVGSSQRQLILDHFSIDRVADQYLELFEDLTGRAGQSSSRG